MKILKQVLTIVIISFSTLGNCQIREVKIVNQNIQDAISIYLDSVKVDRGTIGVLLIEFTSMNKYSLDSTTGRAKVDISGTFKITTATEYDIRYLQPNMLYFFEKIPVIISNVIDRLPSEDPDHTKKVLRRLKSSLAKSVGLSLTIWFSLSDNKLLVLKEG